MTSPTDVPLEIRVAAERERRRRETETLYEFIPRISGPKLGAPHHLSPLVELLDRSLREPVFALVSVPPQYGKTETALHCIARRFRARPTEESAYISYSAGIAEEKSAKAMGYARRAGVRLGSKQSASHWTTAEGGSFYATGIGGGLTSRPISGMLLVDDPSKNREEAERVAERDRVEEWLESTAFARCHPGTSVIIIHTRWHEDDLIARLKKRKQVFDGAPRFEVINLQAVNEYTGEPLWPELRPLEWCAQKRADVKEHNWWSLYMGRPRPRGGELFRGHQLYDELPKRYRMGKGLDLAYTGETKSDASAAYVLLELHNNIFVADRAYGRMKVPLFVQELKRIDRKFPGTYNFLCSSLEAKGVEMGRHGELAGVSINPIPTTSDKWVRAQPFANAWNGVVDEETKREISKPRVFLPRGAPWLPEFLERVNTFTGVGDKEDDDVDALASAFYDLKDLSTGRIYVPKGTPAGAYRLSTGRGLG